MCFFPIHAYMQIFLAQISSFFTSRHLLFEFYLSRAFRKYIFCHTIIVILLIIRENVHLRVMFCTFTCFLTQKYTFDQIERLIFGFYSLRAFRKCLIFLISMKMEKLRKSTCFVYMEKFLTLLLDESAMSLHPEILLRVPPSFVPNFIPLS